ncbi:MAG: DinB family protein [Flavobacteriaceae bacterium]|nr:DinB family protein [Flavobacteriaceae bacterium]
MTDLKLIIEQLQNNKTTFESLLDGIDDDMQLWKPDPESWCMLEILCHLVDEERLDFRFRAKFILEKPGVIPPPFNPLNWVTEHRYMDQDFEIKRIEFSKERADSLNWLKSLNTPDWNLFFTHPKLGKMTAGYYINNWLAHDYLHIKQIIKRKFDYLKFKSGHNLDYAGTW